MSKIFLAVIFSFYSLTSVEVEYPDLGGILDFSKPKNIYDRLFILLKLMGISFHPPIRDGKYRKMEM